MSIQNLSEDALVYIQSMAQVVSELATTMAAADAEAAHDLIDEIGARAHRIIDQAREAKS